MLQFCLFQMTSPGKLLDFWKGFEKSIDREKELRETKLDRQLTELYAKLSQHTSSNEQAFTNLRERVEELKEKLSEVEGTKKEVDRNLQDEIAKVESNFSAEVDRENQKSREENQNWTKSADEKLLSICHSMDDVTNDKGETIEGMTDRMSVRLTALKETIAQQKKKRERSTNELNEAIQQELNRLYGELEENRKIRENTSKKIAAMAHDIESKLIQEIEEEKRARKQTNKALLNLLEETCAKIERAFF